MPIQSGYLNHSAPQNPAKFHTPFADPVSITALRADAFSSDGKSIIISLASKYSNAERRYSVPLECFRDFLVDLRRLNPFSDIKIETSI
jgi:hypothetical protein